MYYNFCVISFVVFWQVIGQFFLVLFVVGGFVKVLGIGIFLKMIDYCNESNFFLCRMQYYISNMMIFFEVDVFKVLFVIGGFVQVIVLVGVIVIG